LNKNTNTKTTHNKKQQNNKHKHNKTTNTTNTHKHTADVLQRLSGHYKDLSKSLTENLRQQLVKARVSFEKNKQT
jgi:tRNA C32,U32 (ribose-2'-O)-methylase TrmJ